MEFRNRQDGITYSLQAVRALLPGASVPQSDDAAFMSTYMDPHGFDIVTTPPMPDDPAKVFILGGVVNVNGHWQRVWAQRDKDEVELAEIAKAEAKVVREAAKAARTEAVARIVVEVNGKLFDGDETSQTRMTRALIGMKAVLAPTIEWTLADNTSTLVTQSELAQALVLSGLEQSRLWKL